MNSKSKYNSLSVAVLASLIVLGSPAQAQWTSSVGTGATLEETVTPGVGLICGSGCWGLGCW